MTRLMKRKDAANYCGLSLREFNKWVAKALLPGSITGTHHWDKKAIDLYLDRISGLESRQVVRMLTPSDNGE
jgi:hypothetical protein